jgi:cytochrome d ubiquinol oxidase subunit I
VRGINDLQADYTKKYGAGDYLPPIPLIYWSFRVMVGAGTLMLVVAAVALYLGMQNKIESIPLLLKVLPWMILAPFVANSTGWLMAELGRQPWLVFGLMKTEQGVSVSVDGISVLLSLVLFTATYGALMVADIYLLRKYAKHDPVAEPAPVGAY